MGRLPATQRLRYQPSPNSDGRAFGQETLTHSGTPQPQNSSSGHASPPFATRVARFVPVLDSSVSVKLFRLRVKTIFAFYSLSHRPVTPLPVCQTGTE